MRPKTTPLKRKEKIRRKNRVHWSTHKHEIKEKRNMQILTITESQLVNRREIKMNDLEINDPLNSLSINDSTSTLHNELFDNDLNKDFTEKYLTDFEGDDSPSDAFQHNQDEEEGCNEEDAEENLTEQQMEFANEFFDMETSEIPVREYDEIVSIQIFKMLTRSFYCCRIFQSYF